MKKVILPCPIATNVTEFSEWNMEAERSESGVTVGKQRGVGGWLQRGGRSQKTKPLTDEPLGERLSNRKSNTYSFLSFSQRKGSYEPHGTSQQVGSTPTEIGTLGNSCIAKHL